MNITGTAPDVTSPAEVYRSAESTFAFYGDFGGGTLTLEASFDAGVNWIRLKKFDGETLEILENEIHTITLGVCQIRGTIEGAATDPDVTLTIA